MKAATIDALAKLAEAHRLKIRTDVDGTRVIVGRTGQLYEYDDAHLGVIYTSPKDKTSQRWNTAREALVKLGATVRQWGDREGSLSFDPRNAAVTKLAIKVAGCRPKKQLSEAHLSKLVAAGASHRLESRA